MTDKNEPNEQSKVQHEDRAGDILRKERVTKRITVETIAKDLKLNVAYIKALEANQYDALPADPYVRVYLRSIANYLMLNPDEILKRFYRDRGVSPESARADGEEKLSVSLNSQPTSGGLHWFLIVFLVIALAILGFFAYQSGWITPQRPDTPPTGLDQQEELLQEEEEMMIDTTADTLSDTLMQTDTADNTETDTDTLSEAAAGADQQDSLRLVVNAVRDSVWIHVYSDGDSWRNFIYADQARVFDAADSFNLRVGDNNRLEYTLNGEPITVSGSGVAAFKIDHNGVNKWSLSQWNRVFRGRQ
ncbi:MAG: helix-turn-helix domain-containing protein [Chitinivibrionales bacterium]